MHFSLFSKLASDSYVSQAQAFSQQILRKDYYSPEQGTLCSGLTYFWLDEKLYSRSPLSQLDAPNDELLQRLANIQALSYYPAFPENFNPGEKELLLLTKKYGTEDWRAIQQCVIDEHQGDYVLYDLSRMFHYDSASVVRFPGLPQTFRGLNLLRTGSAVIGVLRYMKNKQPDGHRIAYYLDQENRHHFFDPNAGEIIESCGTVFHQWLTTFLTHVIYQKFAPSIEDDFLTLYILDNVSPLGLKS